jgi:hypothetical protein
MKRQAWQILALVTVAIFVVGWVYWPNIRFRVALGRLAISNSGVPTYNGANTDSFGVNTFSDEVSSASIGDLYYAACNRLEQLRGGYPRRTYHWYDLEGWDRVTSVIQFPAGYISVTAANNNDNDSVAVRVVPGVFPPLGHPPHQFIELKELPNDRLPAHTLRFQRPGSAARNKRTAPAVTAATCCAANPPAAVAPHPAFVEFGHVKRCFTSRRVNEDQI